ncbi:flagellar FLiS export co-chaperone [Campylobacter sp. MIT 97-5078]|uniref:flagellar FLiS export co-chaperone n=1 Tax=Campylobacter sp. MIT 97-5078 TaxID=1548153 RepID=UPI000513A3AB|nr:flagellar FLiS export co-chaperone [Campylobacter sp. MIT 97-5078]KGI56662.1 hypothetical protein LR59_06250 [Campylobacter sp. MIT 97-5078]TQR27125.1 hypothetical protein DMB91_05020 [Campylobacter sp. MIT 97-5078]
MSKELEIFKKHLGEVKAQGEFDAKQVCTQINDANDFIGALQVLDLSLKKIEQNLKARIDEDLSQEQKRGFDAQTSQLIQNSSFMGNSLFDNSFSIGVSGQSFAFEIQNPLLVLEKSDYKGVLAYIEDKREEIENLLLDLATAISLGTPSNNFLGANDFDFKGLFR